MTQAHSAFEAEFSNRPVTVTGRYAADRTILVVDRRLGDRAGSWVVTPLVTDGGTVAVLRGFVDGLPSTPPAAPEGVVTVTGSLGPTESPDRARHCRPPSAGRSTWRPSSTSGPVTSTTSSCWRRTRPMPPHRPSAAPLATPGLTRVPPPDVDTPLNLRNAAYAVQWWVFGLFAIWMWWKMFRAEQQAQAVPDAQREEIHA